MEEYVVFGIPRRIQSKKTLTCPGADNMVNDESEKRSKEVYHFPQVLLLRIVSNKSENEEEAVKSMF